MTTDVLIQKLTRIEDLINEVRNDIITHLSKPSEVQPASVDSILSNAKVDAITVPDITKIDVFMARRYVLNFCTEVAKRGYRDIVRSAVPSPHDVGSMNMTSLQNLINTICDKLPPDVLPIVRQATLEYI